MHRLVPLRREIDNRETCMRKTDAGGGVMPDPLIIRSPMVECTGHATKSTRTILYPRAWHEETRYSTHVLPIKKGAITFVMITRAQLKRITEAVSAGLNDHIIEL